LKIKNSITFKFDNFKPVNIDYLTLKPDQMEQFQSMLPWLVTVIIIMALWESVWKFIALWKAGRNNHLAWFVCIAVFNTIGILPIIYILLHRKKSIINSDKP